MYRFVTLPLPLACLGLLTHQLFSQTTPPTVEWQRTLGTVNGHDVAYAVQQTVDGGFILTGYNTTMPQSSNLILIYSDSLGNPAWQKTFGDGLDAPEGGDRDIGYSVQQTDDDSNGKQDDGYIIGGSTTLRPYVSTGYLLKTTIAGDLQWHKQFAGEYASIYSVQQTDDDGDKKYNDGFIISGHSGGAAYLIKTDHSGEIIWQRTYPQINRYLDGPTSCKQTIDRGYILVVSEENTCCASIHIKKTDASGETMWDRNEFFRRGGGGNHDNWSQGFSLAETPDGHHAVTGLTAPWNPNPIPPEPPPYNVDAYVVNIDALGNKAWERIFGGERWDEAHSIRADNDGGYIIAGFTGSSLGGNVYLLKIDSTGNRLWERTFGGPGDDYVARSVNHTFDGGYIVTGTFNRCGFDVFLTKLTFQEVPPPPQGLFVRGDVDPTCGINLTDAVWTLNYLFLGGGEPTCLDAADADDNGLLNITDPVYLLNYLFLGGFSPPPPFPTYGTDPTPDELPCGPP